MPYAPGPRSARPTGSTASSASGRLRRKVGMVEMIRQLADEPWAPVAQGHTGPRSYDECARLCEARTPPFSQRREKKCPIQKRPIRRLAATVCSSSSDATKVDSKPLVDEPRPVQLRIRHRQTDPKSRTVFRGFHRSYYQLSSVSSPSISSGVQMIGIGMPISVRMP